MRLKEKLCRTTVLRLPYHNPPYILTTHLSQKGTGAVLNQLDVERVEYPVA